MNFNLSNLRPTNLILEISSDIHTSLNCFDCLIYVAHHLILERILCLPLQKKVCQDSHAWVNLVLNIQHL